jgi:catechol 2,3-dioxygenase-like lactoylglutathione lyase family enzyme
MEILGLSFAGSATDKPDEMSAFVEETLGLRKVEVGGVPANMYELADGAYFAVAGPRGGGDTSRTIGFRVANVDEAVEELQRAGIETTEPNENDIARYAHFTAPDGKLYELVQVLSA